MIAPISKTNPPESSRQQTVVVSDKRREASRRNGAKSRGPVTVAGKERSRMNAIKSGLFAKVIPHRELPLIVDHDEYVELIDDLRQDFQPNSRFADSLVELLAFDMFRLRFLTSAEMRLIEGPALRQEDIKRRQSTEERFSNVSLQELRTIWRVLKHICAQWREQLVLDLTRDEVATVEPFIFEKLNKPMVAVQRQRKFVERFEADLSHQTDQDKRASLEASIRQCRDQLATAEAHENAHGFRALGFRSRKELNELLSGKRKLTKKRRSILLERIGRMCASSQVEIQDRQKHEDAEESRRGKRIDLFLAQLPDMQLLGRYETHVRRNIDRTLKQLKELGCWPGNAGANPGSFCKTDAIPIPFSEVA